MNRFWQKVRFTKECWEWTGSINKKGYGRAYYNGKQFQSHRLAYEQYKGQIPEGCLVLHKCDNPSCVRPSHLFLGMPKDNTKDMLEKGRDYRGVPLSRERHPMAKLNEEIIKKIRYMYDFGFANKTQLAKIYNVNISTITRILLGKCWRGRSNKEGPVNRRPLIKAGTKVRWITKNNANPIEKDGIVVAFIPPGMSVREVIVNQGLPKLRMRCEDVSNGARYLTRVDVPGRALDRYYAPRMDDIHNQSEVLGQEKGERE